MDVSEVAVRGSFERSVGSTLVLNNVPINKLFYTGTSISVISLRCESSLHLPIIHFPDAYMIQIAGTQYLVLNESAQGCILSLGTLQV